MADRIADYRAASRIFFFWDIVGHFGTFCDTPVRRCAIQAAEVYDPVCEGQMKLPAFGLHSCCDSASVEPSSRHETILAGVEPSGRGVRALAPARRRFLDHRAPAVEPALFDECVDLAIQTFGDFRFDVFTAAPPVRTAKKRLITVSRAAPAGLAGVPNGFSA
jgi:hypothetical protein